MCNRSSVKFPRKHVIDLLYNQSPSGIFFSRADCCNFKNSIIWRCGRLFFFCLGKKLTSTDGIALRIRQTGICRRFGLPFVPKLNFKQWIFQRRLIACHPNIAYNLTTWLRDRHTYFYRNRSSIMKIPFFFSWT